MHSVRLFKPEGIMKGEAFDEDLILSEQSLEHKDV